MKKSRGLRLSAILLALLMFLSQAPAAAFADGSGSSETVAFVHTNDVHGYIDVEPYVKAVADGLKADYGESNVITASAGDVFAGGQAIAHLTEGEAVIDVMNAAGYDVMTAGNADYLNMGGAQLLKLAAMADFPILAANFFSYGNDDTNEYSSSYEYGGQPLDSYKIFTTENGTKIGVFGVTPEMPSEFWVSEYYYSTPTIEAAQECVDALKAEGCDIIVGLCHTGWSDDLTSIINNDTNTYHLAMSVDGIDLIIDGHSHSYINDGAGYVCDNDSKTLIVQASSSGSNIGVVTIEVDSNHGIVKESAYQLSKSDNYGGIEPDAGVLAVAKQWQETFSQKYESKIASTDYFLNGSRMAASPDGKGIRMAEQNLGNLIADALRYATGYDVAMFTGGFIRSSIAAGDITLLDLLNVFANGGTVYSVEITGAKLRELLEVSISEVSQGKESVKFYHISGMGFVYEASSSSIVSVTMADGSALDDEAVYTVAYDANTQPEDSVLIYSGYDELAQMVTDYLQSPEYDTGNYAGPVGRIVELSESEKFTDVSAEDWYYEAVKYVHQKGLFNGTTSTTFSPKMNMTRGMLVETLYRYAGSPEVSEKSSFSDVSENSYYADAIAWAEDFGIIDGMGAGSFAPDSFVTREQFACILYRFSNTESQDESTDGLSGFSDGNMISDWAETGMAWAVSESVFEGYPDNTLKPHGNITRAEVAAAYLRFFKD